MSHGLCAAMCSCLPPITPVVVVVVVVVAVSIDWRWTYSSFGEEAEAEAGERGGDIACEERAAAAALLICTSTG